MRRRSIVVAGLAALLFAPEWTIAQQQPSGKTPRVGILTVADSDRTLIFDAFREGLRDLGYVEGRNILLEFRLAHGDFARLPKLAAELVNLPVDVIVADNGLDALVNATSTIPIVAIMGDPMLLGAVSSLSRPSGNVTGFSLMHRELSAKRLEILHVAFPNISTVAVFCNPSAAGAATYFRATEQAAQSAGLASVIKVVAKGDEDLLALRPTVFAGASGLIVLGDALFWNHRRDVVTLVNAARLPAIYPEREYVEDGGLMAYGTNVPDNFRRVAGYVDRILNGANPGDLPVQQPVKFDFALNLKTAKALGLTFPQTIFARADEVIE
jgi:putative ABC transport system substrate-binding protein